MLDLMEAHLRTCLVGRRCFGHGGFRLVVLVAVLTLADAGCMFVASASLGGDTAGDRGDVRVLFINNTPNRVVFTAGTFDPLDEFSAPSVVQFGLDESGLTLGPNSESAIGTIPCARTFGIGSARLLELARANMSDADLVSEAMVAGVAFFDEAANGSSDGSVSIGSALPFEAKLGLDFPCGALLVVRFEINDVGDSAFRVAFELIPPVSTR